eukprot:jgi/Mesen1/1004/ME000120S00158
MQGRTGAPPGRCLLPYSLPSVPFCSLLPPSSPFNHFRPYLVIPKPTLPIPRVYIYSYPDPLKWGVRFADPAGARKDNIGNLLRRLVSPSTVKWFSGDILRAAYKNVFSAKMAAPIDTKKLMMPCLWEETEFKDGATVQINTFHWTFVGVPSGDWSKELEHHTDAAQPGDAFTVVRLDHFQGSRAAGGSSSSSSSPSSHTSLRGRLRELASSCLSPRSSSLKESAGAAPHAPGHRPRGEGLGVHRLVLCACHVDPHMDAHTFVCRAPATLWEGLESTLAHLQATHITPPGNTGLAAGEEVYIALKAPNGKLLAANPDASVAARVDPSADVAPEAVFRVTKHDYGVAFWFRVRSLKLVPKFLGPNLGGWLVTEAWMCPPELYAGCSEEAQVEDSWRAGSWVWVPSSPVPLPEIAGDRETFGVRRKAGDATHLQLRASNGNWLRVGPGGTLYADVVDDAPGWDTNCTLVVKASTMGGEFQLDAALGPEEGGRRLEQHRSSFVSEDDFKWLAANGANAVRLPAFEWGERHGVRVVLCMHALPGSQNGWEHSAARDGVAEWGKPGTDHIARTLRAVEFFVARPVFAGLEAVNEPTSATSYDTLAKYYEDTYQILRKYSPAAYFVITMRVFGNEREWDNFMTGTCTRERARACALSRRLAFGLTPVHDTGLFQGKPVDFNLEYPAKVRTQQLQEIERGHRLAFIGQSVDVFTQASAGWFFWSYKHCQGWYSWSFKDCVERGYLDPEWWGGLTLKKLSQVASAGGDRSEL